MWLRICDTCNSYVNVYSSGGTAKVRSVVPLWFLAPFFRCCGLASPIERGRDLVSRALAVGGCLGGMTGMRSMHQDTSAGDALLASWWVRVCLILLAGDGLTKRGYGPVSPCLGPQPALTAPLVVLLTSQQIWRYLFCSFRCFVPFPMRKENWQPVRT